MSTSLALIVALGHSDSGPASRRFLLFGFACKRGPGDQLPRRGRVITPASAAQPRGFTTVLLCSTIGRLKNVPIRLDVFRGGILEGKVSAYATTIGPPPSFALLWIRNEVPERVCE